MKNKIKWYSIEKDGYPDIYPNTMNCFLVCLDTPNHLPGTDQRYIKFAQLGWFGGDKNRPYWKNFKNDGSKCIENGSWHVTHWAYNIELPENENDD